MILTTNTGAWGYRSRVVGLLNCSQGLLPHPMDHAMFVLYIKKVNMYAIPEIEDKMLHTISW